MFNGPGNVYIRKQNITTSAAVFYFDYHSQYGLFLKFTEELKLSANAGDELLAQLDDVSYRSPQTRSIETGSIQLYRNGLNVYGVVNGAGVFDEFLTVGGKVKKAGNKSDMFTSFTDNTKVPSRYTVDENRFNALATDNATGVNKIDVKTRREAMAGLEAEKQGLIKGPITREPTGDFEFIDADGKFWDVKSPPSQGLSTTTQIQTAGNSIKSQLTVPNVKVILDCTWMTDANLLSLRLWLNTNLTTQQLERIVEVNINLF